RLTQRGNTPDAVDAPTERATSLEGALRPTQRRTCEAKADIVTGRHKVSLNIVPSRHKVSQNIVPICKVGIIHASHRRLLAFLDVTSQEPDKHIAAKVQCQRRNNFVTSEPGLTPRAGASSGTRVAVLPL